MSEPKPPVPGLRSLIENVFGIQVDDEMKQRLGTKLGTTFDDDPSRWADVRRTLAVQAGEDPEAEGTVDRVVDRLRPELGEERTIPSTWTSAERAIFATREVETAIEEGGPEGLRDGARRWLDEAMAGYRFLRMTRHAEVTARMRAALDGDLEADDVDDLMEDWLNVENGDGRRAVWIAAHPEAFRT